MEKLFWFVLIIVMYIYAGYPSLLKVLSYRKKQCKETREYMPTVTIIIAAHNEEQVIEKKIENILSQDYPKDKLQIIIASDASSDRTNKIVKNYFKNDIELYEQKVHRGKSAALNYVVKNMAKGEIIAFNDATTFLEKDSIRKIISYFFDNSIGAVAGKLIFRSLDNSTITGNHGLYWRYEEFLRKSESKIGYLPFVSGAFYAIRKKLYTPVPEDLPDDSVSPLGVYKQGYLVVYGENALAYETGAKDAGSEFRTKVRGVVRELSSIFHFKVLLNPLKYPLLSWVLFSHRLLRWAASMFLIAIFFASLNLLGNMFYRTLFLIQVNFYLLAVCGFVVKRNIRVISFPFYFSLVNTAALWGIIKYLSGNRHSTWVPVR